MSACFVISLCKLTIILCDVLADSYLCGERTVIKKACLLFLLRMTMEVNGS